MTGPNGAVHAHASPVSDASLGQLTARMSEQVSRLVRDELALAQLEATQKTKRLGVGLGMFGGSGLLAFFGSAVAITAAGLALWTVRPRWWAALIVAAALFVIAGLVAVTGKKAVAAASPPVPAEAIDS